MGRRRHLLLINPRHGSRQNWDLKALCDMSGKKRVTVPLALPLLAAMTPGSWHVEIADENLGRLRVRRRPDLVGITALVTNYHRALELGARFRAEGIPVVLGGPQITALQSVESWAETAVIGEAELTWHQCIADCEAGRLQRRYSAPERCSFKSSPRPRWDRVATSKILSCGVQVSRGCPYSCEFCFVRNLFGHGQRYRDVDDVIAEIRALPLRTVSFVDDNLTANRRYARELVRELTPLGLTWNCQASVDLGRDPELVRQMARSGCDSILIGFESLDPRALQAAGKLQNRVEHYERTIATIQGAGIHVLAAFIVGFDEDTPETFARIREFVERNRLSYVMLNALLPYPGSDLYHRLEAEGRLTEMEMNVASGLYPMSTFKQMSQVQLFQGLLTTLEQTYSYDSLQAKAVPLLTGGAFKRTAPEGVDLLAKLRLLGWVARNVTARDRARRRFYQGLLSAIRHGRLEPAVAIPYALTVESVRGYLQTVRRDADWITARLRFNEQPRTRSGIRPAAERGSPTMGRAVE